MILLLHIIKRKKYYKNVFQDTLYFRKTYECYSFDHILKKFAWKLTKILAYHVNHKEKC